MVAVMLAATSTGLAVIDLPLQQKSAELAQIDLPAGHQSEPVPDTMSKTESVSQTETDVDAQAGETTWEKTKRLGRELKEHMTPDVIKNNVG